MTASHLPLSDKALFSLSHGIVTYSVLGVVHVEVAHAWNEQMGEQVRQEQSSWCGCEWCRRFEGWGDFSGVLVRGLLPFFRNRRLSDYMESSVDPVHQGNQNKKRGGANERATGGFACGESDAQAT